MASNGYPQQGENTTQQNATASQTSGSTAQEPGQIGWYFVEQYYTILGQTPEQISVSIIYIPTSYNSPRDRIANERQLFYNKRSSLVWGTEGDVQPMNQGRSVSSSIVLSS